MQDDSFAPEPIAIVGMACRFPGANSPEQFWRNIIGKVESITTFSEDELSAAGVPRALFENPRYVRAGAALDDIEGFDAALFGITAREAELMDPQHRLFLECCWSALDDAALATGSGDRRIGVFAGCNTSTYLLNQFDRLRPGEIPELLELLIGNDKDYLSTRVSYRLNLRGPSVSVGTACSTSLVAVTLACQALHAQTCDAVLAGAACINVPQRSGYLHRDSAGSLSADGHCRAFDAAASGAMPGNGVGVVVMKRLSDALADGDQIWSLIRGYALSNDGDDKVGYVAPSVSGHVAAVREALDFAEIDAGTIGYVEAHGTGTALGDPIELAALTAAFRVDTQARQYCALGSVKTNIGHAGHAAGMAGLIKASLALHAKTLPPSLHFERPNPALELESSPFFVLTETRHWQSTGLRRAAVSSLGIGGTNAHLVLEEYPQRDTAAPLEHAAHCQLLPLSAKTPTALAASALALAERLEQSPTASLASVARTLQRGRRQLPCRGYVVARSVAHAATQLRERRRSNWDRQTPANAPEVVFAFPGLGLVEPRVLQPLAAQFPMLLRELAVGIALAREVLGFELSALLSGTEQSFRDQPPPVRWVALLITECALARLLMSLGIQPSAVIGHSSGEFAAACISGALPLRDAIQLVGRRAELSQRLPTDIGMLTVNLSAAEIAQRLGPTAEFAAFNADDVTLLAGSHSELSAWQAELAGRKIVCQRSDLPYAAHSRFVEPGLDALAALCAPLAMRTPELTWISTVTGLPIADAGELDNDYWLRHARQPVRFAQAVGAALATPGRIFIEVGPRGQLSSLIGRIARGRAVDHVALGTLPGGETEPVEYLLSALGRLWALGVPVVFDGLGVEAARHARLPPYPFEHKRYWAERSAHTIEPERAPRTNDEPPASPKLYRPIWVRSALPVERAAAPDVTILFGGADPLCDAIESALGADRFELDLHEHGAELAQLFAKLADAAPRTLRLLFVRTARHERGPAELVSLLKAFARAQLKAATELCIVTRNASAVLGSEAIEPYLAGCLAAVRVAPREMPELSARSIDLDDDACSPARATATARQLRAELETPAGFHAVAYRNAKRWQSSYAELAIQNASAAARAFRRDGVYVITGGLGGVGQILARHLAQHYGARLVLTHTRALPDEREWRGIVAGSTPASAELRCCLQRLLALEDAGASVRTARVDVADGSAMRQLFADVQRSWGPIHGVVHLAASLRPEAFAPMRDTSELTLASNFRNKVSGARVLAELFESYPVEFCCVASSIATELGGFANFAYAAANRALDALAHAHNGEHGVRWLSVDWDAMRPEDLPGHEPTTTNGDSAAAGALLTPALRALLAHGALRAADLPQLFEQALAAPEYAQLIACAVTIEERLAPLLARSQRARDASNARPDLSSAYLPPSNELERGLVEIWQSVLGVAPIGVEDSFFELGGDSLVAVRLTSQCSEQLGLQVALNELVREPTIAGVCRLSERRDSGLELFALKPSAKPRHNLICVPFPGGSVFSYEPLARQLPDDYALWVVPSMREARDPERLFERLLAQVAAFAAPVSIYGHCGGVVTAFELARRIEAAGGEVLQLFAGGIFPDAAKRNGIDLSTESLRNVEDSQLFAFVESLGGLPGALTAQEVRPILVGMREDAVWMSRYFDTFSRDDAKRLRVPMGCLIGSADPMTRGWEQHAESWRMYCKSSSTHLVEGGGHYFVTAQAERVAQIITGVLDARVQPAVHDSKRVDSATREDTRHAS
jgi:phthiocerol/phenolphthiocerol synthesis type-I polyketide synthase E